MDDHTQKGSQTSSQLLLTWKERVQGIHCILFLDCASINQGAFACSHMFLYAPLFPRAWKDASNAFRRLDTDLHEHEDTFLPEDNYQQQQKHRLTDQLDYHCLTQSCHQSLMHLEALTFGSMLIGWKRHKVCLKLNTQYKCLAEHLHYVHPFQETHW